MSSYWRGGNQHPLIIETIVRTLKRVHVLANAIPAEQLAKELLRHGYDANIVGPAEYMSDLWQWMKKYAPPKASRPCLICSRSLSFPEDTRVKYCSSRCRQKAYRKRQIARHGRQAKRNETNETTDVYSPATVQS